MSFCSFKIDLKGLNLFSKILRYNDYILEISKWKVGKFWKAKPVTLRFYN